MNMIVMYNHFPKVEKMYSQIFQQKLPLGTSMFFSIMCSFVLGEVGVEICINIVLCVSMPIYTGCLQKTLTV